MIGQIIVKPVQYRKFSLLFVSFLLAGGLLFTNWVPTARLAFSFFIEVLTRMNSLPLAAVNLSEAVMLSAVRWTIV
ncbi:hypothetical protein D0T25_23675 [Duganella sp. BJB488]|uniref:hypothetical protein n=1 Tax=unclassified Duganella TaxID=2636909 RepID=UPI000E344526|nr:MULTISPECIES: hypothetical protein [unclassified Duganella]RFP09252.1 hypothetical protein D0T23_26445 [Duganella sp. BJB475]RFP13142.1 hypothetical protein D0T26_22880 [Duganella sp. BJB489]RFP17095.1 hypothetical protein D0T25_23675 [Duganella sp. BJB488]RFP25287.1 hypothetical protein D0T21_27475 [Duganella sp. BJB476]RFP31686.1 hypothetical protein D0T24_25045 [Duganella sp. BJB480]